MYIYLVGGFNPSAVGIMIPNIWKNTTCSKPPTSYYIYISIKSIWFELLRSDIQHQWFPDLDFRHCSRSGCLHPAIHMSASYIHKNTGVVPKHHPDFPRETIIITIVIITITTITVLLLPPWNGIRQIRFPLNSCLSSISPQILRWKTGCYKMGPPR